MQIQSLGLKNYEVVIVGAGPVGITIACALKAINDKINICVIDKRFKSTRDHGLSIKGSAVKKICQVLDDAFKANDGYANLEQINNIKKIFKGWQNGVQRTREIELQLAKQAKKQGIAVFRGQDFEVAAEPYHKKAKLSPKEKKRLHIETEVEEVDFRVPGFDELLEGSSETKDQNLSKILKNAKVILGTGGAHDEIRKKVMEDKISHEKTFQYILELKFDVPSYAKKRNLLSTSKQFSIDTEVSFETLSRKKGALDYKPATLHLIVNKKTYDAFKLPVEMDGKQRIKGEQGCPWSMDELRRRSDPDVQKVVKIFDRYIAKKEKYSKGKCHNFKVTGVPLAVFCSKEAVKIYKGKMIALAGDANSGLIFAQGFNKGIKEAAHLAKTTSDYFKAQSAHSSPPLNSIPVGFLAYQDKARKLYTKEVTKVTLKDKIIKVFQKILKKVIGPLVRPFFKFGYFLRSLYQRYIKPLPTKI